MATSTPRIQERSQYHSYWGSYATATALPNAALSTATVDELTPLQAGDTAFVDDVDSLYVCVSPGTPGNLDALWRAASYSFSLHAGTVPGVIGPVTVYFDNDLAGSSASPLLYIVGARLARRLTVNVLTNTFNPADTTTFAVYRNGVASGLTVSIVGGNTGVITVAVDVPFASGDTFDLVATVTVTIGGALTASAVIEWNG